MNALAALVPRRFRDPRAARRARRRDLHGRRATDLAARGEQLQESPREGSSELWRIGVGWENHVNNVRGHALHLPLPFDETRYEDLHNKPVETARRLFQFCQIPCDDELLEQILERTHRAQQLRDLLMRFERFKHWIQARVRRRSAD